MSSFQEILSKSFSSFESLEQAAEEAAKIDGFVVIRKSTEYSEGIMLGGCLCCYKCGKSSGSSRGAAKCGCLFHAWFRRQTATGTYFFTKNRNLEHNHALDKASTTMSAMARRFTPSQRELVESMRSNEVPVPLIVAELRKNTDAMIQKRMCTMHQGLKEQRLIDCHKLRVCFLHSGETQILLSKLAPIHQPIN